MMLLPSYQMYIYHQYLLSDSTYKMILVKSSQGDSIDANAEEVTINRAETSIRQLSEWGLRMIQGKFPRVTDTLVFDDSGDKRVFLRLLVHLYNFNYVQVGCNEILILLMESEEGYFQHP